MRPWKRGRDLGGFCKKRAPQQQHFGAIEMARFLLVGWVDGVGWIGWVLALLGIYLPFCLVLSTFLSLHPSLQQTSPLLQNSKPILPSFLPHKLPHLPTPPLLPTPKKSYNTIQYNTIQ